MYLYQVHLCNFPVSILILVSPSSQPRFPLHFPLYDFCISISSAPRPPLDPHSQRVLVSFSRFFRPAPSSLDIWIYPLSSVFVEPLFPALLRLPVFPLSHLRPRPLVKHGCFPYSFPFKSYRLIYFVDFTCGVSTYLESTVCCFFSYPVICVNTPLILLLLRARLFLIFEVSDFLIAIYLVCSLPRSIALEYSIFLPSILLSSSFVLILIAH